MTKMFISRWLLAAAAAAAAGPALAQAAAPAAPAAAASLSDGEIRTVDKENAKLTIKHGPLRSLDMPGMTMVFGVKDAAMLEKLQPGDKVRFDAAQVDGKFVVTRIEAAR